MLKHTSLLAFATVSSGCTFAQDVYAAGVWVGVVAVVSVLFIVGAAMSLVKYA